VSGWDRHDPDPLAPAKGCANGIVVVGGLWLLLIVVALWVAR
jgi:hypothetical protein